LAETASDIALIVGVGPGLGAALARRFAAGGLTVAVAARDGARLRPLAAGLGARSYDCDGGDPDSVEALFRRVGDELGTPRLVVYNAGAYARTSVLDTEPADFERCWRTLCFGGFLVGRAAARAMLAAGGGTILFTGATAALRGGANFVNLAVGKFGLRALSQSMARELGPQGIHVAHVVIDGQIEDATRDGRGPGAQGADALLHPDAIAEAYWQLHLQPRSAWTQELDLRPWTERF
jgi:NAD(P)-dependent dehydrogenase (short-subunit alcohol dehydrogenase family)